MPSATAAAEPLDEPPGVHARSCGLRVPPGWTNANSVVTVLPRMIAPAALSRWTQAASCRGRFPASVGRRAIDRPGCRVEHDAVHLARRFYADQAVGNVGGHAPGLSAARLAVTAGVGPDHADDVARLELAASGFRRQHLLVGTAGI